MGKNSHRYGLPAAAYGKSADKVRAARRKRREEFEKKEDADREWRNKEWRRQQEHSREIDKQTAPLRAIIEKKQKELDALRKKLGEMRYEWTRECLKRAEGK